MKIGDKFVCVKNQKIYELTNIPFIGTGLTYFELFDGNKKYYVSNGYPIFEYDEYKGYDVYSEDEKNFRFNVDYPFFEQYNNDIVPDGIPINEDVKFILYEPEETEDERNINF